jgi:prepilin-type N-terminal cleavage/methylation domain-containing protein
MLMSGAIRSTQTARRARGFSLIEVMIAMAVLAVGLLGGIMVIVVATTYRPLLVVRL